MSISRIHIDRSCSLHWSVGTLNSIHIQLFSLLHLLCDRSFRISYKIQFLVTYFTWKVRFCSQKWPEKSKSVKPFAIPNPRTNFFHLSFIFILLSGYRRNFSKENRLESNRVQILVPLHIVENGEWSKFWEKAVVQVYVDL